MPVLVDSCIFLDIFTKDEAWFEWSSNALQDIVAKDVAVLNAVVYSEISVRFSEKSDLDALLPSDAFEYAAIPREAAYLAGKCYLRYRNRGGKRLTTLPDFFIGAHAVVARMPLLTRDSKRFRQYFPEATLICP